MGNTFDTGFVYGGGQHEKVLGEWIKTRGVQKTTTVIAKGAHTPYCLPGAIGAQLTISLERLQLESVPIYNMHRDNLAVPVSEFVDALNQLKAAGKIGIFGGSNWSPARVAEANAYAAAQGLEADLLTLTRAGVAFASIDGDILEISAERASNGLAHHQRRAGRKLDVRSVHIK